MQDWELVSHLVGLWPRIPDTDKLEKLLVEGKAGTVFGVLNLPPMTEDQAFKMMSEASAEFELNAAIVKARKALHRNIEDAMTSIRRAEGAVRELSSLGDVEFEGGHADTEQHLSDAGRALRAAQAVKPSDSAGELR